MAEWSWNLHRFSDNAYLGRLEQIPTANLSPAFNAAGAAKFTVELTDDLAEQVENLSTYIVCQRDGVTKWEGKVWNTDEDAASNKMAVDCMGWFEELNHRYTDTELTFTGMSCGRIAWSLLAHAETVDGTMGFVVGPAQDAGFVIPRYTIPKDMNIASEIKKLTEVENGIDFYFDYSTRRFVFTARQGVDRPDVEFGYEAGPRNLTNFRRRRDATRIVNKMKAINTRTNNWVIQTNAASIAERGVYREVMTLNGLKDTPAGSEAIGLAAFATAETAVRGQPLTYFEMSVMAPGTEVDGVPVEVPLPYRDFDLGDTLRGSVDRGRLRLDRQPVRCYGFSLTVEHMTNERLDTIQLSLS